MATAAEIPAEAARVRAFARTVTDPKVLMEIEWEWRARLLDNGGATDN
jgi:hypothetical protein